MNSLPATQFRIEFYFAQTQQHDREGAVAVVNHENTRPCHLERIAYIVAIQLIGATKKTL
jgi:hypothetical protein